MMIIKGPYSIVPMEKQIRGSLVAFEAIKAFALTTGISGCATEHDYSHQISALRMQISSLQERVSDLEATAELKKTSPKEKVTR